MLGRILLGLVTIAVGALAVTLIVKTVMGVIDRRKIENLARSENMRRVIIDSINRTTNRVKITDLDSEREMQIEGDDIDYHIYEGEVIYT